MLRLQFRLADVFWATAAVATLCWLGARERGLPAGVLGPGILFVAAYGMSRSVRGADLALSGFVAAWLWSLGNMTKAVIFRFLYPISWYPSSLTEEILADLLHDYVSFTALPMVFTLPALPLLKRMGRRADLGRRWLLAAWLGGVASGTLLIACLMTLYTVYRSFFGW